MYSVNRFSIRFAAVQQASHRGGGVSTRAPRPSCPLRCRGGCYGRHRAGIGVCVHADEVSCSPIRSPLRSSPLMTASSGELRRSPADRWPSSAFLATAYGCPVTLPSVRSAYSPGGRLLTLEPLHPRFSHAAVAHPRSRHQPGFTVHHAAPSDLTAASTSLWCMYVTNDRFFHSKLISR